ncbi:MAG: hypothetical protein R3E01_04525 [Pirellulaceae bacterium]|nr:hypothetical protein [Planctomycetales bacterium]
MTTCRLIIDPPTSGVRNMAVDEVLLQSAANDSVASLRFYRWEEATLSLGYFQAVGDRVGHAASGKCPLIRRASGGGAIVHDRELTYSLALPVADRWSTRCQDMYTHVHLSLITVLREDGVAAGLYGGERAGERRGSGDDEFEPFLCFQRRSQGDVVLGQHKIVGSAQRRYRGAVLQHGSILLRTSDCAPELEGLSETAGRRYLAEDVMDRWLPRLSGALNITFRRQTLAEREEERVNCLAEEKYGQAGHTQRR